jgi:ABC-type antimicrobial peptide transport system permease subunit
MFRLAATIANYGWLSGAIVINGADHARLWSQSTASELAVNLKPGVEIRQAKQAIQRALPSDSALSVQSDSQRRAEVSAVLGSTLTRLNDTTFVVLIAAVASVIALVLAAIWQRRDRLNSLMSIGMSTGQFARLVSYETGTVLLSGCVIGVAAGLVGQYLIDGWLHHTTGASVQYSPAWLIGLRTVLIAAAISAAATAVAVLPTAGFKAQAAFSAE